MKSRQVGFVLMTLILIGIIGMGLKLLSADGDEFVMEGLMPITKDVITRVEISRGPESTQLYKIDQENWRVGKHQASSEMMYLFWEYVSDIPKAQLVARNPENHELFQIDDTNGTRVAFYLEQAIQEEFLIGEWSENVKVCYVRKSAKNHVYGIPCPWDANGVFSSNSDFWRDRIVVTIPRSEIESFEFIYPDESESYYLGRNEEGDWIVSSSDISGYADLRRVDDIVRIISTETGSLVAMGFADESISKTLDFNSPDGSLRINTVLDQSIKLKFIQKDTDSYYVKKPNDPTVYLVDSESARILQMPQSVALTEN